MALLIEDGTGVPGATSYADVAEARAYALARNLTLPVADADVEVALTTSGDYLLRYEARYKGARSNFDQRMSFPRYPVYVNGYLIASDEIPETLKEAQILLCIDSAAGTDLRPDGEGQETIMEKVGPITVQYAETGSNSVSPVFNKALDLLRPLMAGGGAFSTVVRA